MCQDSRPQMSTCHHIPTPDVCPSSTVTPVCVCCSCSGGAGRCRIHGRVRVCAQTPPASALPHARGTQQSAGGGVSVCVCQMPSPTAASGCLTTSPRLLQDTLLDAAGVCIMFQVVRRLILSSIVQSEISYLDSLKRILQVSHVLSLYTLSVHQDLPTCCKTD